MRPEWRWGAEQIVSDREQKTSKHLWQQKTGAETVSVAAIICLGEKGLRADSSVTVRQLCGIRETCDSKGLQAHGRRLRWLASRCCVGKQRLVRREWINQDEHNPYRFSHEAAVIERLFLLLCASVLCETGSGGCITVLGTRPC